MPVTQNILVPLDGSTLAEEALAVALEIAASGHGKITLLVVAEREAKAALADFADAAGLTGAEAAEAYLSQVVVRYAGPNVDIAMTSSDGTSAAEEILSQVKSEGITMIVLTSHGRSGISRWVLGSVCDKVLRSSPVPVTVVPVAGRTLR